MITADTLAHKVLDVIVMGNVFNEKVTLHYIEERLRIDIWFVARVVVELENKQLVELALDKKFHAVYKATEAGVKKHNEVQGP